MRLLLSIPSVRVPTGRRGTAMILNVSSPQPAHPNLLPGGATRRGLCLSAVVCPGRGLGRAPLRGLFLAGVGCRSRGLARPPPPRPFLPPLACPAPRLRPPPPPPP